MHCQCPFRLQIGAQREGALIVQHEQATISCKGLDRAFYEVQEGGLVHASEHLKSAPKASADRLFLTAVSGVETFRPLFDALAGTGFYNINPEPIREIHPHDRGELLDRSGRNLAAMIKRLSEERPGTLERIQQYLRQIVPGIEAVDHISFGPRETLEFRQAVLKNKPPWRFYATSMSDGTLRSLGVLTALFQFSRHQRDTVPLIAIEEPESTIHPGAANILMDAILEASRTQQIIVTAHSRDLLDHIALKSSNILAVKKDENDTLIAPVDEASLSAIKDGLYTPGELLRNGQLQPDLSKTVPSLRQSDLFDPVENA